MAAVATLIAGATAYALWLPFDAEGTPYQNWAFAATIAVLTALVGLLPTRILPLVDEKGYTARMSALHGYLQAVFLPCSAHRILDIHCRHLRRLDRTQRPWRGFRSAGTVPGLCLAPLLLLAAPDDALPRGTQPTDTGINPSPPDASRNTQGDVPMDSRKLPYRREPDA